MAPRMLRRRVLFANTIRSTKVARAARGGTRRASVTLSSNRAQTTPKTHMPHGCRTTPPALKGESTSAFNDSERGGRETASHGKNPLPAAPKQHRSDTPDWDPESRRLGTSAQE